MPRPQWAHNGVIVGLAVLFSLVTLVIGLGTYGLWEPWEVDRIESALNPIEDDEDDLESENPEEPLDFNLPEWIIAQSYDGQQGEAGLRLPGALISLITVLMGLLLGSLIFGVRPAVYGSVVMTGMPVLLISARLLLWSPLPILAFTMVVGGAAIACFGRLRPTQNGAVGLGLLVLGGALGYLSGGLVIGIALPALAAGLGLIVARGWRQGKTGLLVVVLSVLAFVVALVMALALDVLIPERARTDPTFEDLLKRTLLGTFPWTGLIIIGLGSLAKPEGAEEREIGAASVLLTSIGISFGVQSIWVQEASGYPLLALWPLAMGAGLLLNRMERDDRPRTISALVCGLLMLLGLRDHLLEPSVSLSSLVGEVEFPEGLSTLWWFSLMTVVLGLPLVLAMARGPYVDPLQYREWFTNTFGWLAPRSSRKFKLGWLVVAVPSVLFVHAIMAALLPNVLWFSMMGCLERRIWIAAGCLLPAMIAFAVCSRALWELLGRLGRWKTALILSIGALSTMATTFVAFPEISNHLSNRSVIQAYELLADEGEPLYSYRASTTAAELVGGPEIADLSSVDELVKAMTKSTKAFAIIRAEDLSKIDVQYRKQSERHIPVADHRSSSTLLLASELPDEIDVNPLLSIVPYERPTPRHKASANFEERISLLGIDVEGPGGREELCPADSFKLRFYWKCLRNIPGRKKIFVHIDGYGLRINGDHEPANGQYLTNQWLPGDHIVDEQELRVPLHFRPGDYSIFVGFFQGSKRMKVVGGAARSDNRVKAGILKVR